MKRIASNDPLQSDSWAWSKRIPDDEIAVATGCQPIYKLHGSANWHVSDGDPILIIGGEKARSIGNNKVLSFYAQEFERWLSMGTRLMVIGYGFRDVHINATITRAADKGLQMFIIDPLGGGLADALNRTRQANQIICPNDLEKVFEQTLIGASRRGLRETFGLDNAEHSKVMRFFDV